MTVFTVPTAAKQLKTKGTVRITGEVTVSALSSPYLSMLRDCKCLVRCQVSVCLSQFPWLKSGGTRARLLEFRITPSDQASRSVRPASAESTSSSLQTAFIGALTPSTGVRRSARLRARCDRAAMALAGCALGRSAPRSKGSTGARSRGAQRLAAKRHWWPSGRSGAGWRRSQGLPWVGGGLGGALRRQGRRSSFGDFSAPCPPSAPSPRSLAWAEF